MPNPTTTQLPPGIEIFRAGRHIDDAGRAHSFSEADLAAMATVYDPALREAPLTVGHPEHNLPAYGWVKGLRATASVLLMDAHQVEPQFAEMTQAGRFKKRSASFYPPNSPHNPKPGQWYLRHVAFLGAQPPAVAGLKDIQFSDGDGGDVVNFSETVTTQEQDDMKTIEQLQAELDAEKAARLKADADAAEANKKAEAAITQAASFAETAKAERKAKLVSFAEAQVQAGRVLPKDKDMLVSTLDALADVAPVQFSEGTTTRTVNHGQWLQDLIAGGKPVVQFGEFAPSRSGVQAGDAKGKSDAEIDAAAQAYAREHKVSYAEGLGAVTATFSA